ncbi:sister chromatid cohesion protein PDS5 homolog B [Galendromus occidentalis]|uniref:Sister chromatid cohesion protein PDS5 homolog B n=1 Tax=Galendromus occidentalis TaxID=34638 RepID=A0AAJ6W153_9ACAR|nr:sister chromatid cohesion protein PDS5 homolog B [Galendromus occidentalis]
MAHLKVVYPPGVKEIFAELPEDDLARRLKECAQAFQNMNQEDDNSRYSDLALHLASEFFLDHHSKDVRLLIACCIADVFRVFAPEAPYKDPEQLKAIFEFFIQQLRGLEDPKNPTFKRYFYLLENLASVKTFNICLDIECDQLIICNLYALILSIVNDFHSSNVRSFMVNMLCPLINEADTVSQKLMDTLLAYIVSPKKGTHKVAAELSRAILENTKDALRPHLQSFFNNYLVLGKTGGSVLIPTIYELIYELNHILPETMAGVLPQLEMKLKCKENNERLEVTKLVARMFSEKNSNLAGQYPALWNALVGRFNDIKLQVRMRCVQYSMHFLLNQPSLRADITNTLKTRQHDPNESVRFEVVMAIVEAAKKNFESVSIDLLNIVKERTLDKNFKVRREALLGLAHIYKNLTCGPSETEDPNIIECISWIKNKVLHIYYQSELEDRLIVERILHSCLVPYQLPNEVRTFKLYQLFATCDEHAVKALIEILKCQHAIRQQIKQVVQLIGQENDADRQQELQTRIVHMARNLPEPVRAQEYLFKLAELLKTSPTTYQHMVLILDGSATCANAEQSVKEVLKALGLPVQTNSFFVTIKQMLERIAPVVIDSSGIKQIFEYVQDSLRGNGEIDVQCNVSQSGYRGLELLHTLSGVFPNAFMTEEIFEIIYHFLGFDCARTQVQTLLVLSNVSKDLEVSFPNIAQRIQPVVQNFVENGTPKQAKYAVQCLYNMVFNKDRVLGVVIDHLKHHLTLESPNFETALVSLGHIALLLPETFYQQMKSIVSKIVVKELLMTDKEEPRMSELQWCDQDALPHETRCKLAGLKMMGRWLVGLSNLHQQQQQNAQPEQEVEMEQSLQAITGNAASTLRLLVRMLKNQGDLMEKEHVSDCEKSYLRLWAASCILKVCSCTVYADVITQSQFQRLVTIITDPVDEVREKFAAKLHKRLMSLQLPLQFMALLSYGGIEPRPQLKAKMRHYLLNNITRRREYLKANPITTAKLLTILPDYVVVYLIHLMAHDPLYEDPSDVSALNRIKECLWFQLEPHCTKNENYSFSYFKKLLEGIKRSKDRQDPTSETANHRLYAICDLTLALIMAKTSNFNMREVPQEARLPAKLFVLPDKSTPQNSKFYLPCELGFTPPRKIQESTNRGSAAPQGSKKELASGHHTVHNISNTNDSEVQQAVSNILNSSSAASAPQAIPSESILLDHSGSVVPTEIALELDNQKNVKRLVEEENREGSRKRNRLGQEQASNGQQVHHCFL